jgi:hypothetical protein
MKKLVTLVLMLSVILPGRVSAAEFRMGFGGYDTSDTAYTIRTPVEVVIGEIVYFYAGPKTVYTPTGTRFGGIWAGVGLDYRFFITENLSIRPFMQFQGDLLTALFDQFWAEISGGTTSPVDTSRSFGIEIGITKTIGLAAYYRMYDYQNGRLSDVTGSSGLHKYRGVMLYMSQQI